MSAQFSEETVIAENVLVQDKQLGTPLLTKKVVKEVKEGSFPEAGEEVWVHYTGKLQSGEKFDSSVDRGRPFCFKAGIGSVIKGWDVGVSTMRVGDKCILECAPEFAYGAGGAPPVIPANATLYFLVERLEPGEQEGWCTVC
jgi:FKBP-type peptidyl-prolyl cis-trans isomerase